MRRDSACRQRCDFGLWLSCHGIVHEHQSCEKVELHLWMVSTRLRADGFCQDNGPIGQVFSGYFLVFTRALTREHGHRSVLTKVAKRRVSE